MTEQQAGELITEAPYGGVSVGPLATSPRIGKLAAALAKAQGAFDAIEKTRTVDVRSDKGSYKFDYAPLDEVLRAVRPHLAANGLSFTQLVTGDSPRTLTTVLLHESGEWLSSSTLLPPTQGNRAQELGSTITYMRRYTLLSLLGVVADEDDDGNAGDGNDRNARDREPRGPKAQQPRNGNSSPPSQNGSQGTSASPANSGSSSGGQPAGDADKAKQIDGLLQNAKDGTPSGLGLTKSKAFDWLKDLFGRGTSTQLTRDQQDAAALLAVAAQVGQEQFEAKRAEMAKAGRCSPGKAAAA